MANENNVPTKQELNNILQEMQKDFNGCPLFDEREKGSLNDLEGRELHIADLYPLDDYHCIIFEEIPDYYFLTGGALKDLCNKYDPKFVIGRCIRIEPMIKTKSRRAFRPIKVLA